MEVDAKVFMEVIERLKSAEMRIDSLESRSISGKRGGVRTNDDIDDKEKIESQKPEYPKSKHLFPENNRKALLAEMDSSNGR